jgi:hypothetical protein
MDNHESSVCQVRSDRGVVLAIGLGHRGPLSGRLE